MATAGAEEDRSEAGGEAVFASVAGGFETRGRSSSCLRNGLPVSFCRLVSEALQFVCDGHVERRFKQQRFGQPLVMNARLAESFSGRHLEASHVKQNLQG